MQWRFFARNIEERRQQLYSIWEQVFGQLAATYFDSASQSRKLLQQASTALEYAERCLGLAQDCAPAMKILITHTAINADQN